MSAISRNNIACWHWEAKRNSGDVRLGACAVLSVTPIWDVMNDD